MATIRDRSGQMQRVGRLPAQVWGGGRQLSTNNKKDRSLVMIIAISKSDGFLLADTVDLG